MKIHRMFRRILYIVLCAVLVTGTAQISCAAPQTITVCVPESTGSAARIESVSVCARETAAVSHIAQASLGELNGILSYAAGHDPNAGKSAEDPGQNTKNNVALSLLALRNSLRGVRTLRWELTAYADNPAYSELCVYTRRFLCSRETCLHTGILFDDETQTVLTADGTGVLGIGYDFNYAFDTFSAAPDPWQRNFGFCRLYDQAAFLIGDYYETVRIPFRYDGKDWMIQLWKGVYSWNMLGGEIGLYNKPLDRFADFYDCANDAQRLEMAFSIHLGTEEIVQTKRSLSWWQTMFTVHKLAPPSALCMDFSVTFPNAQMLRAFLESLRENCKQIQYRKNWLEVTCVWPADS